MDHKELLTKVIVELINAGVKFDLHRMDEQKAIIAKALIQVEVETLEADKKCINDMIERQEKRFGITANVEGLMQAWGLVQDRLYNSRTQK